MMSIVVDMERPDRGRRTRDLIVGGLLAAPIAAVLGIWAIPALVHAVIGGARDFDSRLREQDRYMQELCMGPAMDPARDEALCGCVLAVEYPSLDCQHRFQAWLVTQQSVRCGDAGTHESNLAFCTCVGVLADNLAEAQDESGERNATQGYARCAELPDALLPPELSSL